MLKLLAQFFSTLAGTHKHDDIDHEEMKRLKGALEANKDIVRNQLVNFDKLKAELEARTKEKTHLVKQLEKAVREADEANAELKESKDKLRQAQNDKTALTMTQTLNAQLRKEVDELRGEQEKAIAMLKSFELEMRKN